MMQQQPYPTEKFLNRFYKKDYYRGLYWGTHIQPKDDREKRRIYMRARLEYLNGKLPLKGKRILDYGSGTGVLIEETERYDCTAIGTDIGQNPQGTFNLIVSIHVIEHLHDPVQTLKNLRGYLTPGGSVFIEVPDTAIRTKVNDFHIAHITYFTQETLRMTVQKAGYTIIDQGTLADCKTVFVLAV